MSARPSLISELLRRLGGSKDKSIDRRGSRESYPDLDLPYETDLRQTLRQLTVKRCESE